MAEELSYYNDFDFAYWNSYYKIGRMNSPTVSTVNVANCPE
jgi:hypothetical protein